MQLLSQARIAVLGAGHVGPVIARMAIAAGYHVSIAASGDPEKIMLMTQILVPGAEPRWAADAVVGTKLVVDAMNYWPPVNGVVDMFEDRRYTSSEIVQRRLARSTVVKTLNHIGYHEMDEDRRTAGSADRRALGVAGDDPGAVNAVAEVVERIGYDAVRLDTLSAGRLLEPGGPAFGVSLHRAEFGLALHAQVA